MSTEWLHKRTEIQELAIKTIAAKLEADAGALLVMPTGTGKTEVAFAVMQKYIGDNKPVLWLTHRSNLKDQCSARGKKFFGSCRVTEFHGKTRHFNSDVVVGMVPTLAVNKGYKSLSTQLSRKSFSLVVVDECHHSPAAQFTKILNLIQEKKIPCLGLTATPRRSDGRPLHPCFGNEPAFLYSFTQAMEDKTIAEPYVKLTLTNTTIKGVPTKNGEYLAVRKLLDRKIVINARNKIIVDKVTNDAAAFWNAHKIKPKYITYCINIAHAQRMTRLFAAVPGIKPALYVGDTTVLAAEDRVQVLRDFSLGKSNMLCVVDLMNEGVDIPEINTLIMCRPTYSNTIYAQQLGRGTRPGKPYVLVFDFFDNYTHAYGARTATNTSHISVRKKNIEIDRTYVDTDDHIAIEERVTQAFQNIDAYQNGVRNFYPTKEEVYVACKELNITSSRKYHQLRYQDARLPSAPDIRYVDFKWAVISGTTQIQIIPKGSLIRNQFVARLPEGVVFKPGQKWSDLKTKYKFICADHGPFIQKAGVRFGGVSCCPTGGRRSTGIKNGKQIKNTTTGVVYESAAAAGRAINISASNIIFAIKNGRKSGGYLWAYVDEPKK